MSTKWFKGPPPSIGWWSASTGRNENMHRWWNGTYWSVGVLSHRSKDKAGRMAFRTSPYQSIIEWTHRPKNWPKRSYT